MICSVKRTMAATDGELPTAAVEAHVRSLAIETWLARQHLLRTEHWALIAALSSDVVK